MDSRLESKSRPKWLVWIACLGMISSLLTIAAPASAAQGPLIRVSANPSGSQADGESSGGVVSGDGRYVAFTSSATNLVPGDTNGRDDVFRFDRTTGQLAVVSVTASGEFVQASHGLPVISGDGRFVAFWSEGVFDDGDIQRTADVILKDMSTGLTERLTVAPDGSNRAGTDRFSRTKPLAMTDDGRWVVFQSGGTNLVAGDIEDEEQDLFVRDRGAGLTSQLSVEANGLPGASNGQDAVVSGSGAQAYVAFRVMAADRTSGRMVVRNLNSGIQVDVLDLSESSNRQASVLALAASGSKLIISGGGTAAIPFEYDIATGVSTPLQDDVDWSSVESANFSPDLRFFAAKLVSTATTKFVVVDRENELSTELPVGVGAAAPDQASTPSSISDDGSIIAFSSPATNLVPGDTNGFIDSFIVTLARGLFADDDNNAFEADIEWLAAEGVTLGCAPDLFCPAAPVTREQMASFLVRALHLPASTTDVFTDDETSAHEADINALAAAGVTQGCGPGRFCPTISVSRQEMASFLARAFELGSTPTDFFDDDPGSLHEQDINALAEAGVTLGCATRLFCPFDEVRRDHMAAFLHRALS